MAEIKVEMVKPVKPRVKSVTLTLTEREAQVLHFLTGCIFGCNRDRQTADNIWHALENEGISYKDARPSIKLKGTINTLH